MQHWNHNFKYSADTESPLVQSCEIHYKMLLHEKIALWTLTVRPVLQIDKISAPSSKEMKHPEMWLLLLLWE